MERQNEEYHIFDTLLSFAGKPPFVPAPLQRFAQNARVTLQKNKQGNVLGVYNPANNKFEVFDPVQFKYALYVYQVSSLLFFFCRRISSSRLTYLHKDDV